MKTCWVRVGEEEFEVGIDDTGGTLAVTLSGRTHRVDLIEILPACYTLIVDGASHRLVVRDRAGPWVFELDGRTEAAEVTRTGVGAAAARAAAAQARHGEIRAPMPGLLLAVPVDQGAQVVAGQPLAIMEAMKMQMEIRAPHAGTVRRVHVSPGQELAAGQLLISLG
ncbi:MAG TPA: biotin/lipoyl-containing protein [bacterium]|nr:biotin/lipoyl-containing protein [bacterium]